VDDDLLEQMLLVAISGAKLVESVSNLFLTRKHKRDNEHGKRSRCLLKVRACRYLHPWRLWTLVSSDQMVDSHYLPLYLPSILIWKVSSGIHFLRETQTKGTLVDEAVSMRAVEENSTTRMTKVDMSVGLGRDILLARMLVGMGMSGPATMRVVDDVW
jgi:hypothetical protein